MRLDQRGARVGAQVGAVVEERQPGMDKFTLAHGEIQYGDGGEFKGQGGGDVREGQSQRVFEYVNLVIL